MTIDQSNSASAPGSPTPPAADYSKSKWAVWLPIMLTIVGLIGGGVGWAFSQYVEARKQAAAEVREEIATHNRMLQDFLVPIEQNLKLTASIYHQLENFNEQGLGILESYLDKERNGKNQSSALTFPLITNIVELDAQINSQLKGYAPYQLTPDFKSQSEAFLEHANTYIVRVKALPDIAKKGGDLPRWKPFPKRFPAAVDGEIAERRSRIAKLKASQ